MIEVSTNSIVIRNVDLESDQYKRFMKQYTVWDKVNFKPINNTYTVIGNDIFLPATVTPYDLKPYFFKKEVVYKYEKIVPCQGAKFNMKNQPRSEVQKKAFAFLKHMYDDSIRSRYISMGTNLGKTFTSIYTICYYRVKAMILVDTSRLAEQWKAEFLKHTDIPEDKIVILSGQKSVDKALANPKDGIIYIAMHKTLGAMLDKDVDSVVELSYKLGIGMRIFDEAHTSFKNTCRINSFSNVMYTIYLSATPRRSNYQDNITYEKIFGNIPYFDGSNIEKVKYHQVFMTEYNTKPNEYVLNTVHNSKHGTNVTGWVDYITDDNGGFETFINHITEMIDAFEILENDYKLAIMLPQLKLIDKVKAYLEAQYEIEVGKFVGGLKPEKAEVERNKRVYITTQKIFEKGLDDQDLDALMMCCPISSATNTQQILGRLRNRPGRPSVMIDCTDVGFYKLKAQANSRKTVYNKLAESVEKF